MSNHVHLIAVPQQAESLAAALATAHSRYAKALNRTNDRHGHLWQNRYFSCALDQRHLRVAMRYVESNPVRAGLCDAPWDWPWSSARAHIAMEESDLLMEEGWTQWFTAWKPDEWRAWLGADLPASRIQAIRQATLTGEPLGAPDFVARLERWCGRVLHVRPRGRPPKQPRQNSTAAAASLGPMARENLFPWPAGE